LIIRYEETEYSLTEKNKQSAETILSQGGECDDVSCIRCVFTKTRACGFFTQYRSKVAYNILKKYNAVIAVMSTKEEWE